MQRGRKRPSRLKWIGIVLALLGIVWAWRVGKAEGEQAITKDPMLLLGPMLLIGPGMLMIILSRILALHRSPLKSGTEEAADAAASDMTDLLD